MSATSNQFLDVHGSFAHIAALGNSADDYVSGFERDGGIKGPDDARAGEL
jgi:hypothetical protein